MVCVFMMVLVKPESSYELEAKKSRTALWLDAYTYHVYYFQVLPAYQSSIMDLLQKAAGSQSFGFSLTCL